MADVTTISKQECTHNHLLNPFCKEESPGKKFLNLLGSITCVALGALLSIVTLGIAPLCVFVVYKAFFSKNTNNQGTHNKILENVNLSQIQCKTDSTPGVVRTATNQVQKNTLRPEAQQLYNFLCNCPRDVYGVASYEDNNLPKENIYKEPHLTTSFLYLIENNLIQWYCTEVDGQTHIHRTHFKFSPKENSCKEKTPLSPQEDWQTWKNECHNTAPYMKAPFHKENLPSLPPWFKSSAPPKSNIKIMPTTSQSSAPRTTTNSKPPVTTQANNSLNASANAVHAFLITQQPNEKGVIKFEGSKLTSYVTDKISVKYYENYLYEDLMTLIDKNEVFWFSKGRGDYFFVRMKEKNNKSIKDDLDSVNDDFKKCLGTLAGDAVSHPYCKHKRPLKLS